MDTVFVQVGDIGYLPHMKALAVNAIRNGYHHGDFCFVLGPTAHDHKDDLERRGIYTVLSSETSYFTKLNLFSPFFKKWRRAFYCDSDVIIQRPLQPLYDIPMPTSLMVDQEPCNMHRLLTCWNDGQALKDHPELADFYWSMVRPEHPAYIFSCFLWNPRDIEDDAEDNLLDLKKKIEPINMCYNGTGSDAFVLIPYFRDRINPVIDRVFAYFEHAGPQTAAVHYCAVHAPWVHKDVGDGAYMQPVLRKPCIQVYNNCAVAFDFMFPRK